MITHGKTLTLYHGIADFRWAEEIARIGFGRRGGSFVGEDWGLYLTDNEEIARQYAAQGAWERGDHGAILRVRVFPKDLRADVRAYVLAGIEPPPRSAWEESLDAMGSVVHRGGIPPNAVTNLDLVSGRPPRELRDPRPLARTLGW